MIKMRKHVERQIIRRFILDAVHAGYSLTLWYERPFKEVKDLTRDEFCEYVPVALSTKPKEILKELMACDDEWITVHDAQGEEIGTVFLVYGNGPDVISDYHTNLEPIIKGALAVSREYE